MTRGEKREENLSIIKAWDITINEMYKPYLDMTQTILYGGRQENVKLKIWLSCYKNFRYEMALPSA